MVDEFIETHSGKHLDRYGVWIKKTPETKKTGDFDFFSTSSEAKRRDNAKISSESAAASVEELSPFDDVAFHDISDDSDIKTNKTDNAGEYDFGIDTDDDIEVLTFDSDEDKAADTDKSVEKDLNGDDGTVEANSGGDAGTSFDDMEEIDLDDFFADSAPVGVVSESSAPENTRADFAESDEADNLESEDSHADGEEQTREENKNTSEEKGTEKSSSSAFDDMLDELTGSGDDMVEVSLDDFFDDDTPPAKQEDDEVQEIPEPKTTVEEFSLASIKASNKTETASGVSSSATASDASNTDSFEEISLDDFFANDTVVTADNAVTAESSSDAAPKNAQPEVLDLSVTSDDDADALQEVSVTGYNEVENIDLFGNEVKPAVNPNDEKPVDAATENTAKHEKTLEKLSFGEEPFPASEPDTVEDDFLTNEVAIDPIEPIEPIELVANEDLNDDDKPLSDLAAIVDDQTKFTPEAPDFLVDTDDAATCVTHNEETSDDIVDDSIAENDIFDDVSALTNDLLQDGNIAGSEGVSDMESSINEKADEKTNELLMQLVSQISSMQAEIAGLKDEIRSVKDVSINAIKSSEADDFHLDIGTPDDGNNSVAEVEVPTIESFDNADSNAVDTVEPETSKTGFFSDDNSDETVSLTGDELENIISTADFTEESTDLQPEEFDAPEVLNLDETVSADEQPLDDDSVVKSIDEMDGEELDIPDVYFDEKEKPSDTSFESGTDTQADDEFVIPDDDFEITVDSEPAGSENTVDDIDAARLDSAINSNEMLSTEDLLSDTTEITDIKTENPFAEIEIEPESSIAVEDADFLTGSDSIDDETEEKEETFIDVDDITSESTDDTSESDAHEDEDMLPAELLAQDDEPFEIEPMVSDETEEPENFNADDLDTIVDDIPTVDLDVQSLDKKTASDVQEQILTVKDEVNNQKRGGTLPIDMKEEIKSVLMYMDQLLESLPEEKIEEFAKSKYFDTYKKLFDDLGIS